MAATKVVDLILRAQTLLKDTTGVRWPVLELQYWLNDSYKEIVNLRPDASADTGEFTCVAGYRQNITTTFATAVRLLDVIVNTGAQSTKRAVRLIDRRSLDDQRPNWFAEKPSVTAEKYVYDPRMSKEFLVYPPAALGMKLEIMYSVLPTPHTLTKAQLENPATTDVIKLDDTYANPMLDYIMYRAYTKDSEVSGNANRAIAHYQAMTNSLGIKTQSDQASQPGVA
jgi:hypothetical protein